MSFINFPSPTPVFPLLPSQAWSVHKEPFYEKTLTETSISGREYYINRQVVPRWEFTLNYGGDAWLRDQTQNIDPFNPLAGYTELEQLAGLFLACLGSYGEFYFDDPDDDSRLAQGVATGDATTLSFPLFFSWGTGPFSPASYYPVGGINTLDAIYFDGVVQPSGNYALDATNTQVVFTSAPGSGVVITADFHFYFRCRFLNDLEEFEQWARNLWMNKALKFQSVKTDLSGGTQIPPPTVLPRAVHFDGLSTVLYRTSALVGASNSPVGTLSCWYKAPPIPSKEYVTLFSFCTSINGSGFPDTSTESISISALTPDNFQLTNPNFVVAAMYGWQTFLRDGSNPSNYFEFDGYGGVIGPPGVAGTTGRQFNNNWHNVIMSWDTTSCENSNNNLSLSLTATANVGDTSIIVSSIGTVAAGDFILINLDPVINNVAFATTVVGIPTGSTIHLADPIPFIASIGNTVQTSTIQGINQLVIDGILVFTGNEMTEGTGPYEVLANYLSTGVNLNGDGFSGTSPIGICEIDLAEFYFNTEVYLDLSNPTNIAKFYNSGHPADLGSDGSIPTGSPPAIYLTIPSTGPTSQFAADSSGNGNDFSINGTLTRATSDPF